MKHIILFSIVAIFAACNADVKVDTPISEARATFAAMRNEQAYNIAVSRHGVTATYIEPDASFHVRFDQCAVIEMDGKTELVDAAVFQISPGVYVAEIKGGGYVRINTVTGSASVNWGGTNRVYTKEERP
jgi:hypothetical protein